MLFSGNTLHILRMVFLEIDQCDIWSSKRSSSQSSHAWVTILYTPIRAAGMYGDMESPPLHPTHTNQRGTDYAEQIGLSPPKLYIPSTYYKNSTINSIRFCTSNQERQKMDIWVEFPHQFLAKNLTLFTTTNGSKVPIYLFLLLALLTNTEIKSSTKRNSKVKEIRTLEPVQCWSSYTPFENTKSWLGKIHSKFWF